MGLPPSRVEPSDSRFMASFSAPQANRREFARTCETNGKKVSKTTLRDSETGGFSIRNNAKRRLFPLESTFFPLVSKADSQNRQKDHH